CQQYNSAPCSF
nr:immunoglobulin light chain junction region [Macaca mulatta]